MNWTPSTAKDTVGLNLFLFEGEAVMIRNERCICHAVSRVTTFIAGTFSMD